MTPGEAIRAYRRAHGLRQRDLANALEIDQPAISEMERGMRAVPEDILARLELAPPVGEPPPGGPSAVPPNEPASEDGGTGEPTSPGDVPPRPVETARRVTVLPIPVDLSDLEARLLKFIQGEDVAIAIADPGETEVRYESAHIPGVADIVGAIDRFDGEIIRVNAVAMSKAWVNLAREKPRVRQVLETLTAGGAWRGVFSATAPVILAILLNHGLLPSVPGLAFTQRTGYDGARDDGGGSGPGGDAYRETAAGSVG